MFKAINHLKSRDKTALAAFLGLALFCFLYFASGILVTYVSSPENAAGMANMSRGFIIQVLGFQTHAAAEKLAAALRERNLSVEIQADAVAQGYLLKIGPVQTRGDAQNLSDELHGAGYKRVTMAELCTPGTPGCDPAQQDASGKNNKK